LKIPKTLTGVYVGLPAVVLVGSLGYWLIEGWPLFDSFYMTIITLTTIGYGEIHNLSDTGRLFTLLLIFAGVGIVGYSAVAGTRFIVEGEIRDALSRRRQMKTIEKTSHHFVVCGYGRMGSIICSEFDAMGVPFVVVENDPGHYERIASLGYLAINGDATDESVLIQAGVNRAKGLVSVLNSDASNVYVVLSARELNPSVQITARAGDKGARKKLLRAGANQVVSPYRIGGTRMVMAALQPTITNFMDLVADRDFLDIEIEEIVVDEDSQYCDILLIETDIRRELNLIIVAIKRAGGFIVFNPGPKTAIHSGDTLVALGERTMLKKLAENAMPGRS
jgi:voltage-gated potassium channel